MLDPAFAIGLAASIVQIINFIKGVLTKSHEIYQSTDGVLVQNADLECVAVSFSKLLAELRENSRLLRPQTYVSRVLTQADAQLRTLSSGVDGILVELLNTLNSLKVDPQHTRWDSIRQSLRSTLKEAELEDLEKRLERYRQQIDTALLVSLRYVLDTKTRFRVQAKAKGQAVGRADSGRSGKQQRRAKTFVGLVGYLLPILPRYTRKTREQLSIPECSRK
jgi:vacuolar-type H+-ATPase subunit I/STV1